MSRPVGYLVTGYPAVSHTFVLREVQALRRAGVAVQTYTVRRSGPEQLLSADDHAEARTTAWLLPVRPLTLVRALLSTFLRHPGAAAAALVAGVQRGAGPRGRLWQVFYFVEAVLLWRRCGRDGVRHLHVHFANNAADIARTTVDLGTRVSGHGTWSWSFTMHGPTEFEQPERFGLADKVRDAAFVACISHYCRDRVEALAPHPPAELVLVRCGLDLARHPVVDRVPYVTGERALRVLCVGRLVPEKGQDLLVAAVGELVASGLDVQLVLVGDGPARSAVEEAVARHGLDGRVLLTGALGQDEVPRWYEWADVFALLSSSEGLPVVLMEAMASGLPVVTTRVAGIPELVEDGVTGTLLTPGDVGGAVAALRHLAEAPAEVAEAGRRARLRVAEQHDVDRCVLPLAAVLHRWSDE